MSNPDSSGAITRIGGGGVARPSPSPESLADVLERVLDIELLTLKIRLLIASADTAREMGIDWWLSDPFFSSKAQGNGQQHQDLERRVAELEQQSEHSSSGSRRGTGARRESQAQSRKR